MKLKSDDNLILRLPSNIKIKFKELCDEEMTSISSKLKKFMIMDLKRNNKL